MADEMEYFALVGLNETIEKPSGLIRMENGNFPAEQFDRHELVWKRSNEAVKYVMGYNNDAEPITKEQAEKIEAAWLKEGSPFGD